MISTWEAPRFAQRLEMRAVYRRFAMMVIGDYPSQSGAEAQALQTLRDVGADSALSASPIPSRSNHSIAGKRHSTSSTIHGPSGGQSSSCSAGKVLRQALQLALAEASDFQLRLAENGFEMEVHDGVWLPRVAHGQQEASGDKRLQVPPDGIRIQPETVLDPPRRSGLNASWSSS